MKYLIATITFLSFFISLQAQKTYWQQQVNYNIQVNLNDVEHSLTAHETIEYTNNSPDTLKFIWFHVWMNAYKNDKTAFSEQQLQNGKTEFYFSDDVDRGYTSKLDFSVDDAKAKFEYHPQHTDIIKLILPKPLAPKQTIKITTPFYSKLPKNFSRGGHVLHDYQITQWYPKPAVYDNKGWHEMPYLDIGEFYSEFGNYEVSVNVPESYMVAATGELQDETELNMLKQLGRTKFELQPNYKIADEQPENISTKDKTRKIFEVDAASNINKTKRKILTYKQSNVHDFAWFASKNFLVQYDTLQLNNKTIDCFSFFSAGKLNIAAQSTNAIKTVIKKYSLLVGEYPYKTASVVVGKENKNGGMEYPTITYINCTSREEELHKIIHHEVGHNWFYSILGSNERDHAWMDEGMNTYYDLRSETEQTKNAKANNATEELANFIDLQYSGINKTMPIDTTSSAYTEVLYFNYVYYKAAAWMKELQNIVGKDIFDKAMQKYFEQWKFKHPQPTNFKAVMEEVSGKNLDSHFAKLYSTKKKVYNKPLKINFGFPPFNSFNNKTNINFAPAATYNYYDGIRVGALLHNIQLPTTKFQYYLNPSYGTTSKAFNFFGGVAYNVYKKKYWLQFSANYQNYTYNNFRAVDSNNVVEFSKYLTISRFVPQVKLTLYSKDIRSTERYEILFKTFYLNQQYLNYNNKKDNYTFNEKSYVNRLSISKFDTRILYPYNLNFTVDQTEDLLRLSFTAKQFYNYAQKKGGINARFFAGKIFYLKEKTINRQYNNYKYWFNLIGTNGENDYTFSDYFIGRNETQRGWLGQQIMERDGFFKTRMDYVTPVGKTDDWLMAANFTVDAPNTPAIKLYADIGTYAEAWKDNAATGRFLYTAGVQLSLMNEVFNIYIPILNSPQFRDYNELYLNNKFWQSISFSINFLNVVDKKFITKIGL